MVPHAPQKSEGGAQEAKTVICAPGIIQYTKENQEQTEIVQNYRRISRKGANLLSVCAGIKTEKREESEVVDVCKAVEDMIKDAVEEKEREMQAAIQDANK